MDEFAYTMESPDNVIRGSFDTAGAEPDNIDYTPADESIFRTAGSGAGNPVAPDNAENTFEPAAADEEEPQSEGLSFGNSYEPQGSGSGVSFGNGGRFGGQQDDFYGNGANGGNANGYNAGSAPRDNAYGQNGNGYGYGAPAGGNNLYGAAESDLSDLDLMRQIDDFKKRAEEIQRLIGQRQSQADDLDRLVQAKEVKNQQLDTTIEKKREEADGVMRGVNQQVDRIMANLNAQNDSLRNAITGDMAQKIDSISGSIDSSMDKMQETMQTEILDKFEAQNEEMKTTIGGLSEGFDSIKTDIGERVHTENVKVYRNLQDLIKEMDTSEEDRLFLEAQVGKLKNQNIFLTFLCAVNLGVSIILILLQMGIL